MRLFFRLCACLVASILLFSSAHGQLNFKRVYVPDQSSVFNIGFFTARGITSTNLPGREIALTGAIAGEDSTGFIQSAYLLQLDADGKQPHFTYYTDTTSFLLSGPRGFDLCHDGSTGYYLATGSNDDQVVIRTDNDGNMRWATDVNHHDFYSIVCEGAQVTMLGQDESMLGGHDYSAIQMDSTGTTTAGNLFGSTDFDIPIAMQAVPDGYILSGQSYASPRGMMVVKSSPQLNLLWGEVFQIPGRQMFMQGMATPEDGSAIYCTGWVIPDANGTSDSVFVAKLDTSGNPLWCRLYGSDTITKINANAIIADHQRNAILVGGDIDGTGYKNSFVMRLDTTGVPVWANNYADPDTSYDESVQELAFASDGTSFLATGEYIYIDTNFFTTQSIFVVKAQVEDGSIPCDTPLVFGYRNVTLVPGNVVFPYPAANLPSNPYSYRPATGVMEDSLRCELMTGVSIAEPLPSMLEVVNPASGVLKVECRVELEGAALELRDLSGRLLQRQDLRPGFQQLRLPAWHLSDGLYFLSVHSGDGRIQTRKIILQNP